MSNAKKKSNLDVAHRLISVCYTQGASWFIFEFNQVYIKGDV